MSCLSSRTPALPPPAEQAHQAKAGGIERESGNPAGRPKGSRNKLSEEFINQLYADWCEHGAEVLKEVRETRPEVYVKVVASLLPRKVDANVSGHNFDDWVARMNEKAAEYDATQRPKSPVSNTRRQSR